MFSPTGKNTIEGEAKHLGCIKGDRYPSQEKEMREEVRSLFSQRAPLYLCQ